MTRMYCCEDHNTTLFQNIADSTSETNTYIRQSLNINLKIQCPNTTLFQNIADSTSEKDTYQIVTEYKPKDSMSAYTFQDYLQLNPFKEV